MAAKAAIVSAGSIERLIFLIRGRKVMIDSDIAKLYGVPTKGLNQAVGRNRDRFPPDFMFRLSTKEKQEVVTFCDHLAKLRFSPSPPHAVTEHGAIMVASILNTRRAIKVRVYVVRAFVKLREMLATQRGVAEKLAELEHRVLGRVEQVQALFDAIRQLISPGETKARRIGFRIEPEGE